MNHKASAKATLALGATGCAVAAAGCFAQADQPSGESVYLVVSGGGLALNVGALLLAARVRAVAVPAACAVAVLCVLGVGVAIHHALGADPTMYLFGPSNSLGMLSVVFCATVWAACAGAMPFSRGDRAIGATVVLTGIVLLACWNLPRLPGPGALLVPVVRDVASTTDVVAMCAVFASLVCSIAGGALGVLGHRRANGRAWRLLGGGACVFALVFCFVELQSRVYPPPHSTTFGETLTILGQSIVLIGGMFFGLGTWLLMLLRARRLMNIRRARVQARSAAYG